MIYLNWDKSLLLYSSNYLNTFTLLKSFWWFNHIKQQRAVNYTVYLPACMRLMSHMILIFLLINKTLSSDEHNYIKTCLMKSFCQSLSRRSVLTLPAACLLSFCTSSRGSCLKPGDLPSLVLVCSVRTRRRLCTRTCGAALRTSSVPGGRPPGISGGTLLSVGFDICHSIR